MSYDTYLKCDYPNPETFKNKYMNKSALIIATGPSTKHLLKYKNEIKNKFGVVIGVNHSIAEFEKQLDFHIVMENNPTEIYGAMKKPGAKYRRDLPRIINHLPLIRFFPKNINAYKAVRHNFDCAPNIREYKSGDVEGLFEGYTKVCGRDMGTVVLQSIHFAGILGCNEIYVIGADGFYRDNNRYYTDFNGKNNRDRVTKTIVREPDLVTVIHDGKEYKANRLYKLSADYTNRFIEEECRSKGVEVFDFSNGLLVNAVQLNIDAFMA